MSTSDKDATNMKRGGISGLLAGGLFVVLMAAGIASSVLLAGAAADGGMVTDPEQGVLVPASKEADIQTIEGDGSLPGETMTPDDVPDPGDTTAATPMAGQIINDTDTSGDVAAPLPAAMLGSPTNTYVVGDSTTLTAVYGGADPQAGTPTGMVVLTRINYDTGDGTTTFYSGANAPIKITSASGNVLSLLTTQTNPTQRWNGTLDIQSGAFVMCPGIAPCGPNAPIRGGK